MKGIEEEARLRPHREAFAQMSIGAVVIQKALTPEATAAVREALEDETFTPVFLAHRGRYAICRDLTAPELLPALRDLASFVADERLSILEAGCLRLQRGDYALRRDDLATRPHVDGRVYELTADVSATSSGEAQVVYTRHGRSFFVAPQLSGSVTLVERHPTVERYDRYLNHAMRDRRVHRIRVWFARPNVEITAPPPFVHTRSPR